MPTAPITSMPEKVNVEADFTWGHNGLGLLPAFSPFFPDVAPASLLYNLALPGSVLLKNDV